MRGSPYGLRESPVGAACRGVRALARAVALGACAMTAVPAPGQPATGGGEAAVEQAAAWSVVGDRVMGGVSSSRVHAADGGVRFEGEVRLEFGGGFASIRRAAQWPEDSPGVRLRTRGDGNAYRLVVYTRDPASGRPRPYAYHAVFTPPAGADDPSAVVELRWPAFRASLRGRAVPDAAPLSATDVVGIGVMITKAEHRAGQGAFVLHLAEVAPLP